MNTTIAYVIAFGLGVVGGHLFGPIGVAVAVPLGMALGWLGAAADQLDRRGRR